MTTLLRQMRRDRARTKGAPSKVGDTPAEAVGEEPCLWQEFAVAYYLGLNQKHELHRAGVLPDLLVAGEIAIYGVPVFWVNADDHYAVLYK